jgi:hypothetical protein
MSVGRGAILIGVAFVVGLILLQKTDKAPKVVRTTPNVPTTTPNITFPTTSTSLGGHAPASVKVLVANGTNTPGAASRVVPPLTAAGYNVLAPTDATKTAKAATRQSVVYYTPGYDLDAKIIATHLTLQLSAVQALPTTAPVANTQGANVIVVVGPDLAGASSGTTATTAHTATTARTTATTAHTATTVHTATTARTATTVHTATTTKP